MLLASLQAMNVTAQSYVLIGLALDGLAITKSVVDGGAAAGQVSPKGVAGQTRAIIRHTVGNRDVLSAFLLAEFSELTLARNPPSGQGPQREQS